MNNLASHMGLEGFRLNPYKELTFDEKEDLIDKLETKKYEGSQRGLPPSHPEMAEILQLLSTLKTGAVNHQVDLNRANRSAVEATFRKEKTVLNLADFNRIVDLTAPKGEREPDVTTALWQKQKSSADRAYRKDYDSESVRKFQKKMLCKPMTPQMQQELKARQDHNVAKFDVHSNRQELLAVRAYDPVTYTGLTLL